MICILNTLHMKLTGIFCFKTTLDVFFCKVWPGKCVIYSKRNKCNFSTLNGVFACTLLAGIECYSTTVFSRCWSAAWPRTGVMTVIWGEGSVKKPSRFICPKKGHHLKPSLGFWGPCFHISGLFSCSSVGAANCSCQSPVPCFYSYWVVLCFQSLLLAITLNFHSVLYCAVLWFSPTSCYPQRQ